MMPHDIFDRLRNGIAVSFDDPDYQRIARACATTQSLLNKLTQAENQQQIRKILSQITGSEIDESLTVFPPLYLNYGRNTRFGKQVFVNFNCTFLDLGGIDIADDVLIGPGVKLLSEGHPVSPENRKSLTTGKITLEQNVWIGAGATILAGVTVGENAVVAAGAVVSQNVPANTVVGGIPAKVIKVL